MSQNTMNALDAVSGSLANAYITIDDKRYLLMQLINFEGSMEVNTVEVPILGRTGKGNKPAGWTGTWSATLHYNTSIFRKVLYDYKNTGYMPPMEIQTTNEDGGSGVGSQTIIYKNCLINGGILSKIDVEADYLDEDIEGTFDDWELKEQFSPLVGMEA